MADIFQNRKCSSKFFLRKFGKFKFLWRICETT
uniref:Uncharacterized protein n=1 Tax=Strigamia maritima TaxID=126957 RepID=T1JMN6_STRMM